MTDRRLCLPLQIIPGLVAGTTRHIFVRMNPQPMFLTGRGKRIYDDKDYRRSWEDDPYADIGFEPEDRVWIGEPHALVPASAYRRSAGVMQRVDPGSTDRAAIYRSGWERSNPGVWRSGAIMSRWASRLTFEIEAVKVQHLQDISEEQALGSGIATVLTQEAIDANPALPGKRSEDFGWKNYLWCGLPGRRRGTLPTQSARAQDAVQSFASLWEWIHGKGAWEANPYVAALQVTPHLINIDDMEPRT